MERESKVQAEKIKRIRKKKHVLHYLIVYLACLLVACITWLSVRYSMREDAENVREQNLLIAEGAQTLGADVENLLYV